MFGIIALGILAAVAGLLGYAATRPDTFVIRRETTIRAPADRIFRLIDDFREWRKWSPWEALDADLRRSYEGAERGVGAAYSWEGKKAGAGRMEITESVPPSRLVIDLVFTKPWKETNRTEFTL